jgi:hypothetical protein
VSSTNHQLPSAQDSTATTTTTEKSSASATSSIAVEQEKSQDKSLISIKSTRRNIIRKVYYTNSKKRKFLKYAINRIKNGYGVYNKLYILIYLLLSVIISVSEQTNALILDSSTSLSHPASVHSSPSSSNSNNNNHNNNNNNGGTGSNNSGNISGGVSSSGSLDKFSLDSQIGAIFHRVAYATTTKRSIPDNVIVPSLTTVPTPSLTTFR